MNSKNRSIEMSLISYSYDIATYFSGGVNLPSVGNDVLNSSIGANYNNTLYSEDNLDVLILFTTALTNPEKTILDNIVANYVYYPIQGIPFVTTTNEMLPDADVEITSALLASSTIQMIPSIVRTITFPVDIIRQMQIQYLSVGLAVNLTITNLSTNIDINVEVDSDTDRPNELIGRSTIPGLTGQTYQLVITGIEYMKETYKLIYIS